MPSPSLHLRAPLLWVLVPLIAGIAAARVWPAPEAGLGSLALGAAVLGILAVGCALAPRRWAAVAWAGCLAASAGAGGFVLMHARQPAPSKEDRPPREITATIEVRHIFPSAPSARQFTGLAIVRATGELDRELAGRTVYFSAIRRISVPPLRSGRYVVRGVVGPLPQDKGGFHDYLANLGVHHRLIRAHLVQEVAPPGGFQAFCARMKDRLERILRHGLPEKSPAASLYLAMLLGEKAELSADQENAYMRTGTFHIFSISGLHVGVIAVALAYTVGFLRLPRRWGALTALGVLWFYVQVTGASTPAVRAFTMAAFLMASRQFRLPGNPLAALAASATVTLLWDPVQLFSTGFQMSYSVVVALVTMGQPLTDKWNAAWQPFGLLPRADWKWWHVKFDWATRRALLNFAGCWTAFLASTPSGIGYFELFSPGSLAANLLIIPLCWVVMCAGFISLVAGLPGLLPLSALVNMIAAVFLTVMDWLLRHATLLPGSWFTAHYRAEWLAPVSLALMTAVFLAGAAGRWSPRFGGYRLPAIVLGLLLLFGVKLG